MSAVDPVVLNEQHSNEPDTNRKRHEYYMSHRALWTTRQAAIKRDGELHETLKRQQRESSKRRYQQKKHTMLHCECGSTFRQLGTKAHLSSKKHTAYVLSRGSESEDPNAHVNQAEGKYST